MSAYTGGHPVCVECAYEIDPDREPSGREVPMLGSAKCCRCGTHTRSGIYGFGDPDVLQYCHDDHTEGDQWPVGR